MLYNLKENPYLNTLLEIVLPYIFKLKSFYYGYEIV